jgi:murein DD-endopeptidase MepM/ murein hydrolase activator NlpD
VERTITVRRYPFDELRTVYHGARIPPATRAAEHAIINAVFGGRSGPPQWRGPFAVPLHRSLVINAPFGQRRAYNDEPPYETHWGVDYDAAAGPPVYAPAAGTVVLARPLELRGNTLIVDHGAGVFTLYAHLSAFKAAVGQAVQAGDVIALVGSTGNALGPHLHWEVHVAGPAVEPQEWVERAFP